MEKIRYYKDARYDYELYDLSFDYYNPEDQPFSKFDNYQLGYNYLGYETLDLINIIHNGTESIYYFIDDEGSMMEFSGDDATYITCGKAGYRITPQTEDELSVIALTKEWAQNRELYEELCVENVIIGEFKFLKK
jgi:hypothetical protein